jgi:serine/threonine-protein kinase
VLAVIDDAVSAIATALTAERAARARAHAANDPRAEELYLRGRHAMNRSWWWDSVDEVVGYLREAHQLAPSDARIAGTYAIALARAYSNDIADPAAARTSREIAAHALALQPEQPEALVAQGLVHLGDCEGAAAIRELSRALRVAPTSLDALDGVGRILIEIGRDDDGLALLRRASARDPEHRSSYLARARVRALAGDSETAFEIMDEWRLAESDMLPFFVSLARLVVWTLDVDRMKALLAKLDAVEAPPRVRIPVETMLRTLVNRSLAPESLHMMNVALPIDERPTPRRACFNAQVRAELAAAGNEPEIAMAALRAADAQGLIDIAWLDRCQVLAPIRTHAEYARIRANVAVRAQRVLEAYTAN